MDLLHWLNQNSGAITAAATVLLTIFTFVYVALTRRLVRENVEMRETMSRPSLSVTVAPHEAHINILELTIENTGGGPALGISFEIDWGYQERDSALREMGPFKRGLSRLAPGQRIATFLANAIDNTDDLNAHPLTIRATYRDVSDASYQREFFVDFRESKGIAHIGKPPLFEAADEIKKIRQQIERLVSTIGRS